MFDETPVSPAQERLRLKELFSLNILDTQREERFDRYTRLLSELFSVPFAAISLVDGDRQWFKSAVGISELETPRHESFCVHAIKQPKLLEIPDTQRDGFFKKHPLAQAEPPVRFYAGAVLKGPTGEPLGTLCVFDHNPKRLDKTERAWLLTLAQMVQEDIIDQSEIREIREHLHSVALRDAETGLYGETLFGSALEQLVQEAQGQASQLAMVHLHLSNLDTIAEVNGKSHKRQFLAEFSARLRRIDGLTHGRLSNVDFAVAVVVEKNQDQLQLFNNLLRELRGAVPVDGVVLYPKLEAGVALFPNDAESADDLMDRAKLALKSAPALQSVHFYTRATEKSFVRRHQMEERLEIALQQDLLDQHYQTLVSADGQRVTGVESLARWRDEFLGQVSPVEFIPIAEQSEYLSRLMARRALESACREAKSWPAWPGQNPVLIGVNIPAREFYQPDFVELVLEILAETGLPCSQLVLELTEESLIMDLDSAIETMRELRHHGIHLALDDFGTGYSSLGYLRQLPIDALKLDKSFIRDLPHDKLAINLTQGIIDIAHGLGLLVIAEGVELPSQHQLLQELGCDVLQGYLFAKPVASADLKLTI